MEQSTTVEIFFLKELIDENTWDLKNNWSSLGPKKSEVSNKLVSSEGSKSS